MTAKAAAYAERLAAYRIVTGRQHWSACPAHAHAHYGCDGHNPIPA